MAVDPISGDGMCVGGLSLSEFGAGKKEERDVAVSAVLQVVGRALMRVICEANGWMQSRLEYQGVVNNALEVDSKGAFAEAVQALVSFLKQLDEVKREQSVLKWIVRIVTVLAIVVAVATKQYQLAAVLTVILVLNESGGMDWTKERLVKFFKGAPFNANDDVAKLLADITMIVIAYAAAGSYGVLAGCLVAGSVNFASDLAQVCTSGIEDEEKRKKWKFALTIVFTLIIMVTALMGGGPKAGADGAAAAEGAEVLSTVTNAAGHFIRLGMAAEVLMGMLLFQSLEQLADLQEQQAKATARATLSKELMREVSVSHKGAMEAVMDMCLRAEDELRKAGEGLVRQTAASTQLLC